MTITSRPGAVLSVEEFAVMCQLYSAQLSAAKFLPDPEDDDDPDEAA